MAQWLRVRRLTHVEPVPGWRESTLHLCVHPDEEVGLGIPDALSDAIPPRTVALPSPDSKGFNFDAKEACDLIGIEQWLQ